MAGKAVRLSMGRMWSKVQYIEELGRWRRESQVLIFFLISPPALEKNVLGIVSILSSSVCLLRNCILEQTLFFKALKGMEEYLFFFQKTSHSCI